MKREARRTGGSGKMTDQKPWRLQDLAFDSMGDDQREKATIDGVEIVRKREGTGSNPLTASGRTLTGGGRPLLVFCSVSGRAGSDTLMALTSCVSLSPDRQGDWTIFGDGEPVARYITPERRPLNGMSAKLPKPPPRPPKPPPPPPQPQPGLLHVLTGAWPRRPRPLFSRPIWCCVRPLPASSSPACPHPPSARRPAPTGCMRSSTTATA